MVRTRTRSIAGVALLAGVALIVAPFVGMLPSPAWAAVDCTPHLAPSAVDPGTDSDSDGFTDFRECNGITLDLGATLPDTTFPKVPLCSSSGLPQAERRGCVDPDTKDVFVALVPFTSLLTGPSLLPAGAFDPFFNPGSTFDPFAGLIPLGVIPHAMKPEFLGPGRQVTSVSLQKAIRFSESHLTNQEYHGICNYGSPMGLDGCFVYTLKAKNFIDSVCGSVGDINSPTPCHVYIPYFTWIIQHEGGHTAGGLVIERLYEARFGGYHYKCGSGFIMEQCVTYSTKGGAVKWNIPSAVWTADDIAGIKLKP